MTRGRYEEFKKDIESKGVHTLLPQNIPDRWLEIFLAEDIETYIEETSSNCRGLIYTAMRIMDENECSLGQRNTPDDRQFLTTRDRNISFYSLLLSIEFVSRRTGGMDMHSLAQTRTYLTKNPPTIETIFEPANRKRTLDTMEQADIAKA